MRFIPRDLDAARLMVRARKLDLAAREWVGVRCLLLRRATAAAGGSGVDRGPSNSPEGITTTGGIAAPPASRSTLVLRPTAIEAARPSPSSSSSSSPPIKKSGGGGAAVAKVAADEKAATAVEIDDALQQASPENLGLVVESPKEASAAAWASEVGVGWGGWDSGGGEKVSGAEWLDWIDGSDGCVYCCSFFHALQFST